MATPPKNEVTPEMYKTAVFEEGGNLVVDLQGIQEAKFENVPKGIYAAEIDSAEYGLSQNSGAPMITLYCLITDGDHQGRKLPTYWSFSQKALPFTKAAIARVAPELATARFDPQKVCDEGKLLGKKCRMRVTIEDYNGEPRSRISQLLSAGDAPSANGSGTKVGGFF